MGRQGVDTFYECESEILATQLTQDNTVVTTTVIPENKSALSFWRKVVSKYTAGITLKPLIMLIIMKSTQAIYFKF